MKKKNNFYWKSRPSKEILIFILNLYANTFCRQNGQVVRPSCFRRFSTHKQQNWCPQAVVIIVAGELFNKQIGHSTSATSFSSSSYLYLERSVSICFCNVLFKVEEVIFSIAVCRSIRLWKVIIDSQDCIDNTSKLFVDDDLDDCFWPILLMKNEEEKKYSSYILNGYWPLLSYSTVWMKISNWSLRAQNWPYATLQ